MKKKSVPNWLFIMIAYEEAYRKGRVRRRYHTASLPVTDGWIPNTFWVDKTTAGINGGARRREVISDHPEYFEIISKKEYVSAYGSGRYLGTANYDFTRIKKEKRKDWSDLVKFKIQQWTEERWKL